MFSMLNVTGRELKVRRTAAGIKVYELAAEMGVHSSRVSQIEALAIVTPDTVERYTAALDHLCVVNTSQAQAAS